MVNQHLAQKLQFLLVSLLFLGTVKNLQAQLNGSFLIDTLRISSWPSIHSFAFGSLNDQVLLLGGRIDGIHGKESGFDKKSANTSWYIWDVAKMQVNEYPLQAPDEDLEGFFSAANSAFAQSGQYLFVLGGYGQKTNGMFHTYPFLARIDLPYCLNALSTNQSPWPGIKIIRDSLFAIAGAQMRIKDSTLVIVGGNYFEGKYSSNSSFTHQFYTDAMYHIQWINTPDSFYHRVVFSKRDEYNFHRRDFNLNTIIDEDGLEKLMVYSGVFQYNLNKPFMNTALLDGQQVEEIFDFDHKFCAYNCSRLGLFEKKNNRFHQVFFGGLAEHFRDSAGQLIVDSYVPFVKSISIVSRNENGRFSEVLRSEEMPGYFGCNAEFLYNKDLPMIHEEIIDWDRVTEDTTFLGYVFGGIYNPGPDRNPWQNDSAHLTIANPYVLKISYCKKSSTHSKDLQNIKSTVSLKLNDHPSQDYITLQFNGLNNLHKINLWVQNLEGRMLYSNEFRFDHDSNEIKIHTGSYPSGWYRVYALINQETLLGHSFEVVR